MRVRLVPPHRVNFYAVTARTWHENFFATSGSRDGSREVMPGRELHLLDLTDRRRTGAAYDEPILDGTGRSRFHDRIVELEADLEEADRFGDIERSARTQAELDAVVDELARATGLGGRDRR